MSWREELPGQLSPDEPTLDAAAVGAPAGQETRATMAIVTGTGPHFSSVIKSLLHERLRTAALIATCSLFVYLVLSHVQQTFTRGVVWYDYAINYLAVAVTLAIFIILWVDAPLSLRWLRAIELALFNTIAALLAYLQVRWYQHGWVNGMATAGYEREVNILAVESCALAWVLLIVPYGSFIPNTWRRCAITVGVWSLVCLVIVLVFGLGLGGLRGVFLADAFIETAVLLAIAAAIAIYGSHKIDVLRQEAFEARRLGQYRLERQLGKGGMGEVYLAEHQLLRRPCAVKLISPERASDVALRRFEREVRTTATLTHPNTIGIYDFGRTEDGTFYYAMEYLPGLDLDRLVARYGPLPAGRAVHLLRQACGALREAHAIGLVHRDIKPGNIVACERGRVYDVVKLLDFGLVKTPGLDAGGQKLTLEGYVAGSPVYMSPEQAAGRAGLDPRTDIYSLGATAYYLLSGRPPFERETPLEVLAAHINEPIVPLAQLQPQIPADLQTVIMRCLEKDPAQRFQNVEDLQAALAECACADDWTEEHARQWWRQHPLEPSRVDTAQQNDCSWWPDSGLPPPG